MKIKYDPENKPWHDARPGEIWTLGIGGGYHNDSVPVVATDDGPMFVWFVNGGDIRTQDPRGWGIDYGTRRWPLAN